MQLPIDLLLEDFDIRPITVVHAGANLCQERQYYKDHDVQSVLWIEAIPEVALQAGQMLEDFPEQEIVQAVLWSSSGSELEFNITSNNGESSSVLDLKWHEAMHPSITSEIKIKVKTSMLDEVISHHFNGHIPEISLLVLDLQGAEFDVLLGADETLRNTLAIHTEVSTVEMYKTQKLMEEVVELLATYGFTLIRHDLSESVHSGDALFIKGEFLRNSDIRVDAPKNVRIPLVSTKNWIKFIMLKVGVSYPQLEKVTKFLKRN